MDIEDLYDAEELDGYDDDDDLGALEDIGFSFGSFAKKALRAGLDPTYLARKLGKRVFRGGRSRKRRGGGRLRGLSVMRPARVALGVPRIQTALATPPVIAPTPGLSPAALKYIPFGLGQTSMGVGVTTATLSQQPQIPLKVRKLTVAVGRNGATVAAALVLITSFNIGVFNQFAGSGNVDTAMYIANAEAATMNLTPAGPGINVDMAFLSTIAPAAAESIDISASFLAEAVAP